MGEAARTISYEDHAETRCAPRASVHVSVDLFSEHNFWTGLSMNMSEGGVFIATHQHVATGTMLVMHMSLPFEDEPVVTLAEVRWSRPYTGQEDVPPGLGLAFVGLDDTSLGKIRHFVSRIREPLFFEE